MTATVPKKPDSPDTLKTQVLSGMYSLVERYRHLLPPGGIKGQSIYHKKFLEFMHLRKKGHYEHSTELFLKESLRTCGLGALLEE